jgi:hypothetical protein
MRARSVAVGMMILFVVRVASAAAPVAGPILNPANGHDYYLLGPDTWGGDETSALALGGTLATVRNSQENTWIYTTFTPISKGNLWIGLYDPAQDTTSGSAHAANFVWASGEQSAYRNWASGEPSNSGGVEWYTTIQYQTYNLLQPLQWNDGPALQPQNIVYGVAEVAPEPGSLGMISLAAVMLLRRRHSATVSPCDAAAAGAIPLKSNRCPPRRSRVWIESDATR